MLHNHYCSLCLSDHKLAFCPKLLGLLAQIHSINEPKIQIQSDRWGVYTVDLPETSSTGQSCVEYCTVAFFIIIETKSFFVFLSYNGSSLGKWIARPEDASFGNYEPRLCQKLPSRVSSKVTSWD